MAKAAKRERSEGRSRDHPSEDSGRRRRARGEESRPAVRRAGWPVHQILGMAAVTVGALLLLSVLNTQGGVVTVVAGRLLRRGFGLGSILLPLGVAVFGVLLMRGRVGFRPGRTLVCLGCLFLVFVGVAHLQVPAGEEFARYNLWVYGGALGAGLVFLLRSGFGEIGAYIFLAGLLLVGLAVVLEKPLWWYAGEGGRHAWTGLSWVGSRAKQWSARKVRPEVRAAPKPRLRPAPAERAKPVVAPPPAPLVGKVDKPAAPEAAPIRRGSFVLPSLDLLSATEPEPEEMLKGETEANVALVEETLASFNIPARVVRQERGPVITRYEVEPAPGIRVSRVANLADDLAMALAAVDVRVEAPVPGKSVIGIEVPNRSISFVSLRSVLESEQFRGTDSLLKFALGKDIAGHPMVADLGRMPHLLISGATNSGKSVCLNSIITSLLFNAAPEDVRLVLIDPKRVELSVYEDIPHLMAPIVHDAREASYALRQAIKEMERRYRVFASMSVKNLKEHNEKAPSKDKERLPYIIIIIDELADLMMQAHGEFERLICRLAQLARATGIHLVVATQRPTTDVITGTIKANIPSRIAFAVSSQVDSRTILDCNGAERLIGSGDMLFLPLDATKPVRIQGAFVSTEEIESLVRHLRDQGEPDFAFEPPPPDEGENEVLDVDVPDEEYMSEAVEILRNRSQLSISLLQRKLRIGFNRAARLMETMEEKGLVGPADGVKPRKVLLGFSQPLPLGDDGDEEH